MQVSTNDTHTPPLSHQVWAALTTGHLGEGHLWEGTEVECTDHFCSFSIHLKVLRIKCWKEHVFKSCLRSLGAKTRGLVKAGGRGAGTGVTPQRVPILLGVSCSQGASPLGPQSIYISVYLPDLCSTGPQVSVQIEH